MGGRVDIMLPIFSIDKECFAITPRALLRVRKAGKKWCYPSNKLDNSLSGVYAIFSFLYGFLYVGKAKNIRGRLRQHFGFNSGSFEYLYHIIAECDDTTITTEDLKSCLIIIFPISNQHERDIFEMELIGKTKPIYNVAGK